MKKAFAFVGAKKFVAMTGIKTPSGEKPTSLTKITDALLDYWKGIFNHEPETYLPNLISNIAARYGRFAAKEPYHRIRDVTAQDLISAISHMKASGAAGPGGWRVPELKSLPAQAWVEFQWLTHLYETSRFPDALRELYVTLIPKSDQTSCPEPHDVRPIAVASSVYRAYSRAKSQTLREAVNDYLSPCQHGAREGHSLQQAVSRVLARIEEAKCRQSHNHQWHGFSLDISKCFDTLPSCAIEEILAMTGIDQTVAARIQQMVTGMRRRWRLPGRCLSRHIDVQRGLPQGCSLSVLVANLYMSLIGASHHGGFARTH